MQCVKFTLLLLILSTFNTQATETYKIALLESYPWAYKTESNIIKGIYPALFKALEKKYNTTITFDIQLMPLARIIHEMKLSRIDLTVMSYKDNRKVHMVPQIAIYKTPFVLFTKLKSNIVKLTDIKNKHVAMLIAGSGCPCLPENIPYQKVKVTTHIQGLKMLMKDRVDAVSGPFIRLNERIKQLGIQKHIAQPIIYEWRTVSLWSSNELAKKSKKIDLFVTEMNKGLAAGLMKILLSDYFSPEEISYIKS
jgi:ABC-type amino acid transport substrate-binding protein